MKRLNIIVTLLVFMSANTILAQEEFKASGKPFIKVYSNFHYGSGDNTGFEITRAYLGYKYQMSESWSGKVNIDVGKPDISIGDSLSGATSIEHTAFFKNASLTYTSGKFSVDFGLVTTKQFKVQEKMWGHRYLMKSFQDEYNMGSSADLGITFNYILSDMFSVDISILNGEGYKKIQSDKFFRTAFGVTIKPFNGFVVREYADYRSGSSSAQITSATFVGYKNGKIAAGLEYNLQMNHANMDNKDMRGYSIYVSYDINEKYQLFGRYDDLTSNTIATGINPWNESKNGSAITAGLQFTPIKYVNLALNYQGWMPEIETVDLEHFAYLNVQMAF